MSVSQLTANELYVGADVVGAGPVGAAIAGIAVTCTGPDAQGWFTCTADLENGLTVTRQIRFWEGTAFGISFSPTLTDSVNHQWSVAGTVNSIAKPGKVWTIADVDTATMNVLRGSGQPQHSWTGHAERHQTSTYTVNSVERIFDHQAHDTVTAVTFQMPRSTNPYPISGSIIRNIVTNFTAGTFSKTVTRRYVVTFNGTNTVTLTDGSLTCDLNLDLRTVSNCH